MNAENPRKFVMTPCPTCVYLGITKGDGEGGILFWQSVPGLYECDYEDHFFDEQTLEMILARWPAAPPTDQPAEQARQANGDSQTRSTPLMSDCPSPLGSVCKDPSCRLHYPHNQQQPDVVVVSGGSSDIYREPETGRWVKKTVRYEYLEEGPL